MIELLVAQVCYLTLRGLHMEMKMNLNISLASAKTPTLMAVSEQLDDYESKQLAGRHWVSRLLPKDQLVGEVARLWATPIFGFRDTFDTSLASGPQFVASAVKEPAAIISVTFTDVKCTQVCGLSCGALDKVIMVNPDDPVHSRLFNFRLNVDVRKRSRTITVSADYPHITPENLEPFLRVLDICIREFYQEKPVHFQGRKYIGTVKRRYLFWLKREGKLDTSEEWLYKAYANCPAFRDKEVGLLRNADSTWRHLVATEKTLQKDSWDI